MVAKKRGIFVKLMALLLCLCICTGTVCAYANNDAQQQKENLSNKLDDIDKQKQEIQKEIDSAKNEKEKAQIEKKNLDRQINLIKAEISLLEEKIAVLEGEIASREEIINGKEGDIASKEKLIAATERLISEKEADMSETFDTFSMRLRAMYMSNNISTLGLLLGAESFTEFLTRAEVLRRIAKHDNDVIAALAEDKEDITKIKNKLDLDKQALEDQITELNEEKAALQTAITDLENDKVEQVAAQGALNVKVNEIKGQIQDINALEKEFLARKNELQKLEKQIQAELTEIYKQLNSSKKEYVGGTFLWPVDGFTKITSYYGWRFNNTNFHTGIDISGKGIYGHPARAANTGTVIYIGWQPKGYGNYVIVDHGGGYTTLYAHATEITVKVGDVVAKGDTVCKIGSTGWSSGPHLHFEIRKDGKAFDPLTEFN
ncbi:MAG: peptidoglycan DD-metalloendopeptidase family protein [Oscillospiraceae bacterium]|nr:peptidoglycan DD-metalloendopeptidase family protein [Oscillospiraceae bacterium]